MLFILNIRAELWITPEENIHKKNKKNWLPALFYETTRIFIRKLS